MSLTPYYDRDGITLYCGDNVATMQESIADQSIDIVVTSPPYDNLRTYGGHSWDFEGVAQQLWRVIKPGGVVVWVVADATIDGSETGTSFRQALRFMEIGFRLHDTMIWEKSGFSAVGSLQVRYAPTFEFMFVLSSGAPATFNPLKDKPNIWCGTKQHGTVRQADGNTVPVSGIRFGKRITETGQRGSVWQIIEEKVGNKLHPATFPEALARDHILSWSNEGDIVLDPFLGSGTTAKMARSMGRQCVGIEINEDYCSIAAYRLRQSVFDFSDDRELAEAAK